MKKIIFPAMIVLLSLAATTAHAQVRVVVRPAPVRPIVVLRPAVRRPVVVVRTVPVRPVVVVRRRVVVY